MRKWGAAESRSVPPALASMDDSDSDQARGCKSTFEPDDYRMGCQDSARPISESRSPSSTTLHVSHSSSGLHRNTATNLRTRPSLTRAGLPQALSPNQIKAITGVANHPHKVALNDDHPWTSEYSLPENFYFDLPSNFSFSTIHHCHQFPLSCTTSATSSIPLPLHLQSFVLLSGTYSR
jgi:hypothetical protein